MLRLILFILAWLFVLLGLVGMFIPLLPTVPFLLLALACFDRSSPRFHAWLISHPTLGEPLRCWQESRSIPRRSKLLAIGSIILSAAFSLWMIKSWWLQLFLVLLLSSVAIYLWRLPNTEDLSSNRT